jgi:uncharacterized membrane protein
MAHEKAGHEQATGYTAMGVALGAGVGTTIGVLIGGWAIAIGICLGAGVGVVIGAAMDARRSHPTV